jgi:hypothetical protein
MGRGAPLYFVYTNLGQMRLNLARPADSFISLLPEIVPTHCTSQDLAWSASPYLAGYGVLGAKRLLRFGADGRNLHLEVFWQFTVEQFDSRGELPAAVILEVLVEFGVLLKTKAQSC